MLIMKWRKTSYFKFSTSMAEAIDGEPALEEFELKVALLSRHLTY